MEGKQLWYKGNKNTLFEACDWLKGAGHATSPITLHFPRPLIGGRASNCGTKYVNATDVKRVNIPKNSDDD